MVVLYLLLCLFRAAEKAVGLDSIVTSISVFFFFFSSTSKSPHTLHQYYCNSLALGYLAAAVPHWQIPFVMPSLSPQPEIHWFFFSLLQPCPIHFKLLDMKHFNFCSHFHLDNSQWFPFSSSLCNISFSNSLTSHEVSVNWFTASFSVHFLSSFIDLSACPSIKSYPNVSSMQSVKYFSDDFSKMKNVDFTAAGF